MGGSASRRRRGVELALEDMFGEVTTPKSERDDRGVCLADAGTGLGGKGTAPPSMTKARHMSLSFLLSASVRAVAPVGRNNRTMVKPTAEMYLVHVTPAKWVQKIE